MRVLDGRIRETRLPSIQAGSVIFFKLTPEYLVVVQPGAIHVCARPLSAEVAAPHSLPLSTRALAAAIMEVHGEACICVLLSSLVVNVFALPGLQQLADLGPHEGAAPFLMLGNSAPGACLGSDGYFLLHSATAECRLWWASALTSACGMDEAARLVPAAHIAQSTPPPATVVQNNQVGQPASSSGSAKSFVKTLFGGSGATAPRSLRECVAPPPGSAHALPGDVDAARVDNARGLPPAFSDPSFRPPPPPPRAAASAKAASGVRAELDQATQRLGERGDKLGELADKSQRLEQDANKFLDLAKQLNQRQSSWF